MQYVWHPCNNKLKIILYYIQLNNNKANRNVDFLLALLILF